MGGVVENSALTGLLGIHGATQAEPFFRPRPSVRGVPGATVKAIALEDLFKDVDTHNQNIRSQLRPGRDICAALMMRSCCAPAF